jgi:cytochrome c-type biogenesis protein CcmH/NrfF
MMPDTFAVWVLEQATPVAVLAIGFWLIWRENQRQQEYLERLLRDCWQRVLDCIDRE